MSHDAVVTIKSQYPFPLAPLVHLALDLRASLLIGQLNPLTTVLDVVVCLPYPLQGHQLVPFGGRLGQLGHVRIVLSTGYFDHCKKAKRT